MSINSLLNVVIVVPLYKCGDGTGLGAGREKRGTTLVAAVMEICKSQHLDSSCVAFAPSFRCHLQSSYRHSFVRLEEVRPSSSSFIIRLSRLLAVVVTGGPGHDVKLCPEEKLKQKKRRMEGEGCSVRMWTLSSALRWRTTWQTA